MPAFTKVILYTDSDGRAKFREEEIALDEGTPQALLTAVLPASGCQLRQSPVGFRSQFHCSPKPQWLFVLGVFVAPILLLIAAMSGVSMTASLLAFVIQYLGLLAERVQRRATTVLVTGVAGRRITELLLVEAREGRFGGGGQGVEKKENQKSVSRQAPQEHKGR